MVVNREITISPSLASMLFHIFSWLLFIPFFTMRFFSTALSLVRTAATTYPSCTFFFLEEVYVSREGEMELSLRV